MKERCAAAVPRRGLDGHSRQVGPQLIAMVIGFWILFGPFSWASDYTDAILAAQATRTSQQADTVFSNLRTIGAADLQSITVDDGFGGFKTIEALQVITLTNYTLPYNGATPLQRFVLDAAGTYRSNIWMTLEGDIKQYFSEHHLPRDTNEAVTNALLETLGMPDATGYQVLSFWVEPRFVTRPSFNPSITDNTAPDWNGTTYTFTNTSSVTADFNGIAPVHVDALGKYDRPFDSFGSAAEYENWFDAWSSASFNLAGGREFPFTGLGWTWNWNADPGVNGFGVSEFVVSAGAEYYFNNLQQPIGYIPEPRVLLLVSVGFLLLAGWRWKNGARQGTSVGEQGFRWRVAGASGAKRWQDRRS